uniref:Uncharacterized protein n=1 Tax=Acrobeloides nanus TaxID=290746 RepID=A0A914EG44_9BILA
MMAKIIKENRDLIAKSEELRKQLDKMEDERLCIIYMEFEAEEMQFDGNLEVGDEMEDEEKVEVGGGKPKFVLVEFCQLEKLLQRCPECERLPGGPKAGKPRNINWTRKGLVPRELVELVQDELDE